MSLTKLSASMDVIAALSDHPNTDDGLSSAQLKAKFDQAANSIKTYLNNTLTSEQDTINASKMDEPAVDGTNGQFLQTDGNGNRSWATPSGAGDMLASTYDADNDGVVDVATVAAALQTARAITIADADSTNSGVSVNFDGSGNVTLKLPATIKAAIAGNITGNVTGNLSGNVSGNVTGNVTGDVNGNAATATKLATGRAFAISDYDGSHTSATTTSFDGSGACTIKLPTTIKASFEAGTLVLNSSAYGNSLPAAGTAGRLFFKKA